MEQDMDDISIHGWVKGCCQRGCWGNHDNFDPQLII